MTLLKTLLANSRNQLFIGLILGALTGLYGGDPLYQAATHFSDIYVKFLKLVSTPLIFLSICSTLSSINGFGEVKTLGSKVLFYTVLTTVIAASIGLSLFLILDPHITVEALKTPLTPSNQATYKELLLGIFPSNFVGAFLENNVIAIMIIAFLIGLATLSLEKEKALFLSNLFSSLFDVVIKVTEFILKFIPIAIWAFITLFVKDQKAGLDLGPLGIYFMAVIGANLIQAFIVLPIILKVKGYSPLKIAKGFSPALSLAFFSKSSNVALPTTIRCAQKELGFSKKVSNFSLPLCVTCNMNGCAAFIIITVLFVSSSHGIVFSPLELLGWIGLATLAAIGNAGVPMGCYFLTTAFLTSMNVPLHIMGLILPLYAFLDMVETAVNVWSDGVITAVVEKDVNSKSVI